MEETDLRDLPNLFDIEGGVIIVTPSGETHVVNKTKVQYLHYQIAYIIGSMLGVKFDYTMDKIQEYASKNGAIAAEDKVALDLARDGITVIITALDSLEFFLPENMEDTQKSVLINNIIKPSMAQEFAVNNGEAQVLEPDELIMEINKKCNKEKAQNK